MSPQRVKVQGDLYHGRIPDGAVYIGRAAPGLRQSRYSNPFKAGKAITDPVFTGASLHGVSLLRGGAVEDRAHAIDLYGFWVLSSVPFTRADVVRDLAGRDLACWCPPALPCHGDLLLNWAAGGAL